MDNKDPALTMPLTARTDQQFLAPPPAIVYVLRRASASANPRWRAQKMEKQVGGGMTTEAGGAIAPRDILYLSSGFDLDSSTGRPLAPEMLRCDAVWRV
jgi:hypothetical protein